MSYKNKLRIIKTDFKSFYNCPEIRTHIIHMYMVKLLIINLTILYSPILIIGVICIGAMQLLDIIGSWLITPYTLLVEQLHKLQRSIIQQAHAVLLIDEIRKRNGSDDDQ